MTQELMMATCRFVTPIIAVSIMAALLILPTPLSAAGKKPPPELHAVATAHLDTQWRRP